MEQMQMTEIDDESEGYTQICMTGLAFILNNSDIAERFTELLIDIEDEELSAIWKMLLEEKVKFDKSIGKEFLQ